MYICRKTCMNICAYVYMYVFMHVCMTTCKHINEFVCIYPCMYACMHTAIMLYEHIYPIFLQTCAKTQSIAIYTSHSTAMYWPAKICLLSATYMPHIKISSSAYMTQLWVSILHMNSLQSILWLEALVHTQSTLLANVPWINIPVKLHICVPLHYDCSLYIDATYK